MNKHVPPPVPPPPHPEDWPGVLAILQHERALMEQAAQKVKHSVAWSFIAAVIVFVGAILNVVALVVPKVWP